MGMRLAERSVEAAVDRGVEDSEREFALSVGVAADFLVDKILDVLGHLVGGEVDGDAVYELALDLAQEADVGDVEANRGCGEATGVDTAYQYRCALLAVVAELVVVLAEEHEFGAAGVVLHLEDAELAALL